MRESRWWLRGRRREHSNQLMHWRCLSVSFFAVADEGPTRKRQEAVAVNVKHQIDMIQRGGEIMKSVVAREPVGAKSCVRVLFPQGGSSIDAKSVLRSVLGTTGLTSREEVRTFRRCQYRNNESQSCRLCLFHFQSATHNREHASL